MDTEIVRQKVREGYGKIALTDSAGATSASRLWRNPAATSVQIQEYCAAYQAMTDLSLTSYAEISARLASAPIAAHTQDAGHPYASSDYVMGLVMTNAGGSSGAVIAIPGIKQLYVRTDTNGHLYLNLADPDIIALGQALAAGVLCVNGDPVTTPIYSEMERHRTLPY